MGNLIVGGIVVLIVGLDIYYLYKQKKSGKSLQCGMKCDHCGGGCSGGCDCERPHSH